MAPPVKTVKQYQREAKRIGTCLIHPSQGVARWIYQQCYGILLTKEYVCHRCDNPHCINLRHLFIGTAQDNILDAVKKGRHSCFQNVKLAWAARKGLPHPLEIRIKISEGLRRAYREGRR